LRLFIGIPAPHSQILIGCYDSLKSLGRGVKAVRPENMHITVKFIGDILDDPRSILPILEDAIRDLSYFSTGPEIIGSFPNWSKANTIWLGFSKGNAMMELAASIDNGLENAFGIPRDTRPFRSHLTLARINGPADIRSIRTVSESALRDLCAEGYSIRVGEVTLFSSTLTTQGPIYEKVGSVFVGG